MISIRLDNHPFHDHTIVSVVDKLETSSLFGQVACEITDYFPSHTLSLSGSNIACLTFALVLDKS